MRVTVAARVLGAAADLMWRGPLGAGWLWIAVLFAELATAAALVRRLGFEPIAYIAGAVAAAGLAYVFSFAVAGVADQLRYLHPVIFLAVIAAPLAISVAWRGLRSAVQPTTASQAPTVAYLRPKRATAWPARWSFARASGLTPPGAEPGVRS
jgi:hypothetical protein